MKTNINFADVFQANNSLIGRLLAFGLFFVVTNTAFGQIGKLETEKGLIESIAPYNAEVRKAILVASQNPTIISQSEQIKIRAQQSFQALIKNFDEQKQGQFYEITRFPDLLHQLAVQPNGARREDIERLLPSTSTKLSDAAWQLYRSNKQELVAADNLYAKAGQDYNQLTLGLDTNAQSAFRLLASYPDALTLLSENLDLAAQLGQRYNSNRDELLQQLTETHDSQLVERQVEIAEYKKKLETNPQATQELDQAANDYAQTNRYVLPDQQQNVYINNNYYNNPYSYWFGYPYWYSTPLWYPGLYWSGFRVTFGLGGFGYCNFPAYGFANWFYNGGYYHRYPTLYNHFGNYYRDYGYYGRSNRGYSDYGRNYYSYNSGRNNSQDGYNRSYQQNRGNDRLSGGYDANRGSYSGGNRGNSSGTYYGGNPNNGGRSNTESYSGRQDAGSFAGRTRGNNNGSYYGGNLNNGGRSNAENYGGRQDAGSYSGGNRGNSSGTYYGGNPNNGGRSNTESYSGRQDAGSYNGGNRGNSGGTYYGGSPNNGGRSSGGYSGGNYGNGRSSGGYSGGSPSGGSYGGGHSSAYSGGNAGGGNNGGGRSSVGSHNGGHAGGGRQR